MTRKCTRRRTLHCGRKARTPLQTSSSPCSSTFGAMPSRLNKNILIEHVPGLVLVAYHCAAHVNAYLLFNSAFFIPTRLSVPLLLSSSKYAHFPMYFVSLPSSSRNMQPIGPPWQTIAATLCGDDASSLKTSTMRFLKGS